MMNRLLAAAMLLFSLSTFAQCEADETEVTFQLFTDGWGYEIYYEVVPTGQACGGDALLSGGNGIEVGCDGTGIEGSTDQALESNISLFTEPICLTTGVSYDFIFVDSYGDGGLTVEVYYDGSLAEFYIGEGAGNVWTFEAGIIDLPAYDSPCGAAVVEVDGPTVMMDNTDAIAAVGEITPGGGNCQATGLWCEGGVAHSVWALFEAPASGNVTVSTCNAGTLFDTQVAVYSFTDCLDQSTFSLVGSNDDVAGGCGGGNVYASTCQATCLTPGEMYLVQVDGWFGSVGVAELSVVESIPDAEIAIAVGNINCAPEKGVDAFGNIVSWVYGWGTNFDVTWTGPDGFVSEEAFNYDLAPGEYTGTFSSPCLSATFTETVEVTVADPYNVSNAITGPDCPLSTNGSIAVEVGGATAPYEIAFTGPDGFESQAFEVLDLPEGTYNYVVTDAFGCEYAQEITLESANNFSFSLGEDFEICMDQDSLIAGPGGYLYEWNTGSIDQFIYLDGDALGTGTFPFILTAYNNEGCEYSDAIIITVWACTNGVEEWFASEVKMYPNPSNGQFTLEGLPRLHDGELTLKDQTGRTVHQEVVPLNPCASLEVTADLPVGVYHLQYSEDGKVLETRVVIQ